MDISVKKICGVSDYDIFEKLSEIDRMCIGAEGWSAESFRTQAEKDNGIVICAYAADDIVGLICGQSAIGEAEILSVAVLPSYRQKGIASLLMNEFHENLPCDTENVFLEVRESNESAIMLYKKYGFEKISLRKNFYEKPTENAVVMKKNLIKE